MLKTGLRSDKMPYLIMKKIGFSLLVLGATLLNAQKRDYLLLNNDKNGVKWSYSFDKKTNDGFYSWVKADYTEQQDPMVESNEYFIQFRCSDKTMSDQIVQINYRDQEHQMDKTKMPFRSISENSIFYSLLKKQCK